MNPYFYVIVPGKIPDLNPGKMAAQSCHAQSMLSAEIRTMCEKNTPATAKDAYFCNLYDNWDGGRGFGTVIVLYTFDFPDELYSQLQTAVEYTRNTSQDFAKALTYKVVDQSYPVKTWSGEVYTKRQPTMLGVFVDKENTDAKPVIDFLSKFSLHP